MYEHYTCTGLVLLLTVLLVLSVSGLSGSQESREAQKIFAPETLHQNFDDAVNNTLAHSAAPLVDNGHVRTKEPRDPSIPQTLKLRQPRQLPPKVIVGYMTWGACNDKVLKAVADGVNVVIWFSINISIEQSNRKNLTTREPVVVGGPDLNCVRSYKKKLDDLGYQDVVHLISFGGWNSRHFIGEPVSSYDVYQAWKRYNGEGKTFDGFDWDFEGRDNLTDSDNFFSVKMLDAMGEMSLLAKRDNYTVTMAPPESYLDPTTSNFSRYVNLTYYPRDPLWNHSSTFSYHGANVYAYLLGKFGENVVDLIMVQLYESYSHAAYHVEVLGTEEWKVLVDYVLGYFDAVTGRNLGDGGARNGTGYVVNFSQDSEINLPSTFISIPLHKFVIGLANGWAIQCEEKTVEPTMETNKTAVKLPDSFVRHSRRVLNDEVQPLSIGTEKVVYFSPGQVERAYNELFRKDIMIRGFMFWTIENEGDNNVEFARGLNHFMKIRREDT